jgi:hypothetical protein
MRSEDVRNAKHTTLSGASTRLMSISQRGTLSHCLVQSLYIW